MTENIPERSLLIRSRLADGYRLSEVGLKGLQHVFTDWFPRAIYEDLTDDTDRVDVIVRKDFMTGKAVFSVTFVRGDGWVLKTREYAEERLIGKACPHYDQKRTHYEGNKEGFDHRLVYYVAHRVDGTTLPR